MIDVETLGTRPGSTILSIGAVPFHAGGYPLFEEGFYFVVNRQSCAAAGLREDPRTVAWWEGQDEAAARVVHEASSGGAPIADALRELVRWFRAHGPIEGVWANGAAFDLPILDEAFIRCGYGGSPWSHKQQRCYRTLRALYPSIPAEPQPKLVAHNALDDAIFQARHAAAILASRAAAVPA
jgi:hypothetical protein